MVTAKLRDTWLRRWEDERGELAAIIRLNGCYWLRTRSPAWEPGAGERYLHKLSLSEAREYDYDPYDNISFYQNEQARYFEHDPFFA